MSQQVGEGVNDALRIDAAVSYAAIYRIRFLRGIKPIYRANVKCSCDVVICSEFNDEIASTDDQNHSLRLLIASFDGDYSYKTVVASYQFPSSSAVGEKRHRLSWVSPSAEGKYILCIAASSTLSNPVLPLLSEPFEVCSGPIAGDRLLLPMLSNLRPVRIGDVSLCVREEYGAAIGAHIYDSAIVAIKGLERMNLCLRAGEDELLELGAGCGLTGMWCAKRFGIRCTLTDQPQQLRFLRENVSLNELNDSCNCVSFDWADELTSLGNDTLQPTRLVIAADVLYDSRAAVLLLNVLRGLLELNQSIVILLAQKNRQQLSVDEAQSELRSMQSGLSFECIHEEARVFIWRVCKSLC